MKRLIRAALGIALAILVALLALVGWASSVPRSGPPMLIVAHRGNVAEWPENTAEAVRSALRMGANGVEIDVQRSADGTWYVLHDLDVDGNTNGHGLLAELHDPEIDRLRIDGGLGFRDSTHETEHFTVPHLSEILDVARPYEGTFLLLHVKTKDPAAYRSLVELLAREGYLQRIWIIASSLDGAEAVDSLAPDIHISALTQVADSPEDSAAIDGWLINARTELKWPFTVLAHPEGTVEAFVDEKDTFDESDVLDHAYRWGVSTFLTNDLGAALDWMKSK